MSTNSTDNTKVLQDNWSDNLLIKDASGQLKPFKKGDGVTNLTANPQTLAARIAAPAPAPTDDNFVRLTPIGKSSDKANFGFHPDDEQEIKELVKELPKDASKKYSIEKIIDKLIEQDNLKLSPQDKIRFTDIIFDFFRNRRNAIIVRELISNQILSADKVLSEEEVNNIVSVIKTIKVKIDASGGLVVKVSDLTKENKLTTAGPLTDEVVSSATRPEIADLEKEINAESFDDTKTQAEIKNILSDFDKDLEKPKPKSPVSVAKPTLPPSKPTIKSITETKVVEKPEPEIPAKKEGISVPEEKQSLPRVLRPIKLTSDKKGIADVVAKPTPKMDSQAIGRASTILTGPVEELRSLTLSAFRRLGNSPVEQTTKLLNKINLLEKDSVTKKTQGIEAWRNSEVYNLYLQLGEESLNQEKNVADMIKDYESQKKPTLTIEEFSAISDLNKHLRF